MDYIRAIERQDIRDDIPEVKVGDNVKVHYKIKEGDRQREQVFQGDVIRMSGGSSRETFTVRKISFGVGVERTCPSRQALLPARPHRQGRPHPREAQLAAGSRRSSRPPFGAVFC